MVTWKIKVEDDASKIILSQTLSDDDRQVIRDWAKTIEKYGPEKLLERPDKWADHALDGKWAGYRASSFSYRERIIYKINNNIITVTVVRITPFHDYRR